MKCPNCGFEEPLDEMGYTPLDLEIDNPHFQISVPTCGYCGHKYKDNQDLWCIPPIYFNPNMRVLGGLILTVHSSAPSKEELES